MLALKRWVPSVPGALLAVAAGIAIGAAGLLDVALTGPVPSGLPTPVAPDLDLIEPLWPAALGIALMAFVESIAAGRAVVRSDEHEPNADRERDVTLWLVAVNERPLELLRRSPAHAGLQDRIHPDREAALQRLTVR